MGGIAALLPGLKKPQECYSMFARVEKISQVPQKAVSQTSFSCLKSQDLSANRGCALTGCAIYHLAGFNRDFTIIAACEYQPEFTVDNHASPDNSIMLLSAHLTM